MTKCKCCCSCKKPTHIVIELQGKEVRLALPGPGVEHTEIVHDFSLHSPVGTDSIMYNTIHIPLLRVE